MRRTSASASFAPTARANSSPAAPVTHVPLRIARPFAAARAASWRSSSRPMPRRRSAGCTTGPTERPVPVLQVRQVHPVVPGDPRVVVDATQTSPGCCRTPRAGTRPNVPADMGGSTGSSALRRAVHLVTGPCGGPRQRDPTVRCASSSQPPPRPGDPVYLPKNQLLGDILPMSAGYEANILDLRSRRAPPRYAERPGHLAPKGRTCSSSSGACASSTGRSGGACSSAAAAAVTASTGTGRPPVRHDLLYPADPAGQDRRARAVPDLQDQVRHRGAEAADHGRHAGGAGRGDARGRRRSSGPATRAARWPVAAPWTR